MGRRIDKPGPLADPTVARVRELGVPAGPLYRALQTGSDVTLDDGRVVRSAEVVGRGHGLLIRDTDIARTRLSGAPLAAWPNLMALPVTEVNAVILLARQLKEFSRADLTKGKQVYVEGSLQTRSWEDQNGQKRYKTEVKASNVVMLGRREDGMRSGSGPAREVAETPEPATAGGGGYDDDVPF